MYFTFGSQRYQTKAGIIIIIMFISGQCNIQLENIEYSSKNNSQSMIAWPVGFRLLALFSFIGELQEKGPLDLKPDILVKITGP